MARPLPGEIWFPRDAATKAQYFVIYHVGGVGDKVFGNYIYSSGRRRSGSMAIATLHRTYERHGHVA